MNSQSNFVVILLVLNVENIFCSSQNDSAVYNSTSTSASSIPKATATANATKLSSITSTKKTTPKLTLTLKATTTSKLTTFKGTRMTPAPNSESSGESPANTVTKEKPQTSKPAKIATENSTKLSTENPVSTQTSAASNETTVSAGSGPSNYSPTTTNVSTSAESGSNSTNQTSNSTLNQTNDGIGADSFFHHESSFPVVFMVILVASVAVYIGYHHRNKILKFVRGGLSKSKHKGPGYLKVKLEDDQIDLPREANREYIY